MTQPSQKPVTSTAGLEPGTDDWWLAKLAPVLADRQESYQNKLDWATGNHPVPNGDQRYVRALKDIQKKARTNYIKLVIEAVTQRMRVKDFQFGSALEDPQNPDNSQPQQAQKPSIKPKPQASDSENKTADKADSAPKPDPNKTIQTPRPLPTDAVDKDAKKIWNNSNGDLVASILIDDAATFGDCYAMVSPPDPEAKKKSVVKTEDQSESSENKDSQKPSEKAKKGLPIITAEDPRQCLVIEDPAKPFTSLVGLKLWQDDVLDAVFAVIYLPDTVSTYQCNAVTNQFEIGRLLNNPVSSSGGFRKISVQANPLGQVPLIRGVWKPTTGGSAECEEGAFEIQDRMNYTVLSRLIITNNQAYRQKWMTGGQLKGGTKKSGKKIEKPPFDPGADQIWWISDPDAKFGDFEQADITQVLESIRDDVNDLAAITQTPATYLTNRIANVSADTLTTMMAGLISKTQKRQEAMGWFFERIIKTAFLYQGDTEKAEDPDARVIWENVEIHSLAELGDFISKATAAGVAMPLVLKRAGFSSEDIEFAQAEVERQKQLDLEMQQQQMEMQHEQGMEMAKTNNASNEKIASMKPKPKPPLKK